MQHPTYSNSQTGQASTLTLFTRILDVLGRPREAGAPPTAAETRASASRPSRHRRPALRPLRLRVTQTQRGLRRRQSVQSVHL